jgi:alpha-glucoside transport system substrate-binding protein
MRTPTGRRRAVTTAAVVTALSATLAACGGGGSGGEDEADGSVTIWTSMDAPIVDGMEQKLEEKASEADIDVTWERVTGIDRLIMTKLQASDKPDIAVIPQPGVVANMVRRDGALPLDDALDMDALEESMLPGVVEAGTFEDEYYGLQINASVKSVVFYPKKAWEEAGYPTEVASLDELEQLTQQISDEQQGEAWCLGIFSEGSVGWPATDWFEDLVARFGGVDFYNAWVEGDEPFDSDPVRQSAEWFESNVVQNSPGDPTAIDFGAADDPMWQGQQPGCWMMKQGTFITGFFPDRVQNNLDEEVGVFAFPPAEEGDDPPVVGGGDLATMLVDDADTQEVMQMLAESDIGEEAAQTGAYISPHKDFDVEQYPNEIIKTAAETAQNAEAFLFDGSDQMPGEVGAGTFWSETTAWVGGNTDLDTMLTNIDESWPAS